MDNSHKYSHTTNLFQILRKATLVFTATVWAVICVGCLTKKNTHEIPTSSIEVTANPSGEAMPTEDVTPTATPTPALKQKTLQEVEEELKNVKVSIDDLLNEDVVYPSYFGAPDDSFANEMLKRITYFESFGIMDFRTSKTLVAYLNFCYLYSDAVDKEKADSYLSLIDTDNAVQLISVCLTHEKSLETPIK